jgi:hypothetical protein
MGERRSIHRIVEQADSHCHVSRNEANRSVFDQIASKCGGARRQNRDGEAPPRLDGQSIAHSVSKNSRRYHFGRLCTRNDSIQRLYELNSNQLQFAGAFLSADPRLDGRRFRRNARVGPRGWRRGWYGEVQWRVGVQGPRARQQSACSADIQSFDQVQENGARSINATDKEWNLQSHPRRTTSLCWVQRRTIPSRNGEINSTHD